MNPENSVVSQIISISYPLGYLEGGGGRKDWNDRPKHLGIASAVEFLAQASLGKADRGALLVVGDLVHLLRGKDLVAVEKARVVKGRVARARREHRKENYMYICL